MHRAVLCCQLSGIVVGNVEFLQVADLLGADVHFLADISMVTPHSFIITIMW